MKKRGESRSMRFVEWTGPLPKPGDGLQFRTGRRYVVTGLRRTERMKPGVFYVNVVVLGPEDPDPCVVFPCYSVRRG